ncbi:SDR family oxidoreductase [Calidifontibacillus erzurumensis]|uniref:SDR family oxidoreductase n=1 Tax=Calidifontibacillus erzurumensis TaxID=2741433 RepID=A0A8J8KCN0_9BACI|nr:SDR family oxidoreductase [Calidifontibacillus erzurumensis]NSL52792.1 SDR family oxidoreductase [Calidifontibacillus erzurumensis]
MLNVEGKVVIITGASSGIGEATAKLLAKNGAKVVLAARREERLKNLQSDIEKQGGTAAYKVTNVAVQEEVEELARFALEKYGKIDVLINNAGLMPLSFLSEKKVSEWEQMIDVNIKGVLYGIGAVLPHMRERQEGHIINISSVAGHTVLPAGAVYSGTKFAVRAITEGLRQEELRNNIRATIISPGAVDTELVQSISNDKVRQRLEELYSIAIPADIIAETILQAIAMPDYASVNEIIVRPTKQQ